jgi:fibronectin-binding autotransporter adhesin
MKSISSSIRAAALIAAAALLAEAATAQSIWQGSPGVSATTNWSDANNWNTLVVPGSGDVVQFGETGEVVTVSNIDNVVDSGFAALGGAVATLQYVNTNGFHTTLIAPGVTLNAGILMVGTTTNSGGVTVNPTITGTGGTLSVSGTSVGVSQGSNGKAILDLSGLDNFIANVTTLGVGAINYPATDSADVGTLILAKTNLLTINGNTTSGSGSGVQSGFLVGDPRPSGPTSGSSIQLGQTNALFANLIVLGGRKGGTQTHSMIFYPGVTNASPIAVFRAADGASAVPNWSIGDDFFASGGATVCNAIANFTGGRIDALVTTNIIGRGQGGAGNRGTGTLTFEAGALSADTMVIAYQSGTAAGNGPATGTVNVNGSAVLSVGNILYLTRATIAGAAANTTVGTLNVNGGTAAVNSITNGGGGTSTLMLSQGKLYLTNAMVGPGIVNLNITNSALHLNLNGASVTTNLNVTNLNCGVAGTTTNHIYIDSVTNILLPTVVTLIQYVNGNNAANFVLESTPAGYTTSLDTSSPNQIKLNISPIATGSVRSLTWNGTDQASWNTSSLDWKTNGVNTSFNIGDSVRFDDSLAGSPNVNLQVPVAFAAMVVSNTTTSYVLTGTGKLTGTNGVMKQAAGSLVIDNSLANDYTGGTIINGGTVQVGNSDANGSLGGGVITNNAALVFNRTDFPALTNNVIGIGSVTQNGSGTLVLSGTSSYTGPTLVNSGTLAVNGSLSSPITTAASTTLSGNGSDTAGVDVAGALLPGDAGVPGTLTSGNATLENGATATFDIGPANTVGGGVNDLLQVNGNLTLNNNTLTLNFLSIPQGGVPYRLVNYTGTRTGNFNPSVSIAGSPGRPTATLDTSVPNQINVTFTGFAILVWSGFGSEWDAGLSQSWSNATTTLNPDFFYNGDSVVFDDTAVGANVDIAAGITVMPTAITNNSTNNQFVISGGGGIGGPTAFVKDGDSTLTLSTSNSYTGPTIIERGVLKLGPVAAANFALGYSNSPAYVTNNGTLDIAGFGGGAGTRTLGNKPLIVSGAGFNGQGAIMNSTGGRSDNAIANVTLAGDTTLAANGTAGGFSWNIRDLGGGSHLSTGGHPYNLTILGPARLSLFSVTVDPALANIDVQGGQFDLGDYTSGLGNPANTLTVELGATLSFLANNPPNTTTSLWNKVFILNGDGNVNTVQSRGGSGHTLIGPVQLNGDCILQGTLTNRGPISGPGNLTTKGNIILAGTNSYAGNTTISGGSTVFLTGLSALTNSPSILLLATNSTLDVSGATGSTLSLVSTQALSGNGNVLGSLAVGPNAILAPGNAGIGALRVTNVVTLGGTLSMELDQDGLTNDVITGAAQINYGGILSLTNLTSPLTNGSSFKLFAAASYSGSFSSIVSTPALDAGLVWDTSTLRIDGTLRVKLATASPPTFSSVNLSGTNLVFHGTNAPLSGNYYVFSSTNLTTPLSNWTPVATNSFDGSGGFSFTNSIDPAQPQQFFILQLP